MNKNQKVLVVEEITERLNEANAVYLTNYQGLTVEQSESLRAKFREVGVEFKVLKNTLIRRAMEGVGGYEDIFSYLNGATAVAFTTDPAAPAKVLKDFLKSDAIDKPEFKAAYVDGAVFHSEQFESLVSLKSKDELIGDIIGLLLAPMSNVVGAIQAPGSNIVGALKTIAEKES